MVAGLEERERIKDTFGRFVSRDVAAAVLDGHVPMAGKRLEVSILFQDIRGFSALAEQLDPAALLRVLNRFFTEVVSAVEAEGGLVKQFTGDGVMALFGAPQARMDHIERAARAALGIVERVARLNVLLESAGDSPLQIGIGVHTGEVVAGLIGPDARVEYGVVGDPVNLASRIEALTKDLQATILVSREVAERLGPGFVLGRSALSRSKVGPPPSKWSSSWRILPGRLVGSLSAPGPGFVQVTAGEPGRYLSARSGPASSAKLAVFSTWIPALCSPLNGVTVAGHVGILSVRRRVEPQAQVIHLQGRRGGIHARIREWAAEHHGSRCGARCDGERLDPEDPADVLKRVAMLVGLNVSLIPGHAKLGLRHLEDKKVERGLGGRPCAEMYRSWAVPSSTTLTSARACGRQDAAPADTIMSNSIRLCGPLANAVPVVSSRAATAAPTQRDVAEMCVFTRFSLLCRLNVSRPDAGAMMAIGAVLFCQGLDTIDAWKTPAVQPGCVAVSALLAQVPRSPRATTRQLTARGHTGGINSPSWVHRICPEKAPAVDQSPTSQ